MDVTRNKHVYSRRQFFPMLIQEALVIQQTIDGRMGGNLSALSELPHEQFRTIIPTLNPSYEILVRDEVVHAHNRHNEEEIALFPVQSDALIIFNEFNGLQAIGAIAQNLARQRRVDVEVVYPIVRQVFLALANSNIFLPKEPPAFEMP
jgi:hypothetical protein